MNFTVYKSSAGSGKTFTLVKEYLKIALSDAENPPKAYKHILAITFTNKASAEMKERIINALKEIAEGKNKNLSDIICAETNLQSHEIQHRAENVLNAILHNYSDFAIGTIDSFIHRVVKSFAFDLKLPFSFDIETDSEKLLSQSIDLLISKVGENDKLSKILIEYSESKTDEEKSWHIENELLSLSKSLLNDEGIIHAEKIKNLSIDDFLAIQKKIITQIKLFENTIKQKATKAFELINSKNISESSFYRGKQGIYNYFKKATNENFKDITNPNSYVLETINNDKWYIAKLDNSEKDKINSIKNELLKYYQEIVDFATKNNPEYALYSLINKNIFALAVLNEIEKILDNFKKENNILHISEFSRIISKIALSQPVPFIYERIGEKYKNYLIDEFQDTSLLQFQNILPLIDNSLAQDEFTMLVGDGKQSIYRWRGGEVEQFSKLPEVYKHQNNPNTLEREESLKRNYSEKFLSKNYRSKKEIIEFNNRFFSSASTLLDKEYQNIYGNHAQEFDSENTGGLINIELFENEKESHDKQLEKIYSTVLELKNNNFSLGDIAILVRNNKNGNEVATYLTSKGIPVISSEALLLKKSEEINFITNFIKHLRDGSDEISKTSVLNFLYQNKKNKVKNLDEIMLLAKKTASEFSDFLNHSGYHFSSYILSRLPVYELCEEITRIFKLNEKPNAYIQFFLDEVFTYSTKNFNNLADFIDWWEEKKENASLVIPKGANAVNISTIHASKGLEYPIVIAPFTDWKFRNQNDYFWVDLKDKNIPELTSAIVSNNKEMEETSFKNLYIEEKNKTLLDNLNLLYVAFTRAEKRLYIMGQKRSATPENLTSTSDIIQNFLQTQNFLTQIENEYEFGKKKNNESKESTKSNNIKLHKINSVNWRERIKIRSNSSVAWDEESNEKREFGILMHNVLSQINTTKDIDSSLETMLYEGLISEKQKDEIRNHIENILSSKEIQKLFSEDFDIRNEAEILLPNGDTYRPDRVMTKGENAIIIDFKTGDKKDEHKNQINKYGNTLIEMGYKKAEKYLLYFNPIELINL